MAQTESQKKACAKYRADKTAQVVLTMKKEERENWKAFAASRSIPLATLIRRLMADEMERSGWSAKGEQ